MSATSLVRVYRDAGSMKMLGTLPGRSTIDGTVDHDALDLARQANPQAGAHFSSSQAAGNIANGDTLKIVLGHGSVGFIITGEGKIASDPDKYISTTNLSHWRPHFGNIGLTTSLYLYGCHTGAGLPGAGLLFNMAQTVNAVVLAPTGLIFVDANGQFSLEPGSTWQRAAPGSGVPQPIEPPHIMLFEDLMGDPMGDVLLYTKDGELRVPSGQPVTMRITVYGGIARSQRVEEIDGRDAEAIIALVAFNHPFSPSGRPLAMVTARLSISFDNGITRDFLVLNDRLVQDEEFPEVFYDARPGLKWALRG